MLHMVAEVSELHTIITCKHTGYCYLYVDLPYKCPVWIDPLERELSNNQNY